MGAKKLERSAAEVFLEQALREGRATKQELNIARITADPKLQSRVEMDMNHVKHLSGLMDIGVDLRPIVVFLEGTIYWLADGFHRLRAHKNKLGVDSIWAYVIQGTKRDAILYSASANLENSKPTSKEDRRKAAMMVLADPECFSWSDSEIGRRCGLAPSSIARVRLDYCKETGIDLPEQVVNFRRGVNVLTPYKRRARKPINREPLKMRSVNHRGKKTYRVSVNGKYINLGSDEETAARKLLAIRHETNTYEAISLYEQPFMDFLMRRGIASQRGTSVQNCLHIDNAIVALLPNFDYRSTVEAIGRLVLALKSCYAESRLIIVCHRPHNPHGSMTSLIRMAGLNPLPIEFLTPEEMVAEFGPKGGADQPDGDPPES